MMNFGGEDVKKYSVSLLFFILCAFFSVSVLASDSMIITDFDKASDIVWEAGDAIADVSVVHDISIEENRGNILVAEGIYTDSSVIRTLKASFGKPLNLSKYKSLNVSLYVEPIIHNENNDCFVRIVFYNSRGESFESIQTIEAGRWTEISADISLWNARESISVIELGVIPDHIESGVWGGGFIIDTVAAGDHIDTAMVDRFSFENCTVQGGAIAFAPDKSFFELTPDYSKDAVTLDFDITNIIRPYSNSLRIVLEGAYDAKIFKVSLLRGIEKTPEPALAALSSEDGLSIYNIDIRRPSNITGLLLEFPAASGKIKIHSIEFTSIYDSASYITYGEITECALTSDGKSVQISGKLAREYVTEFADAELYLYSLELNENARTYDYKNNKPIATYGMSTKFKFTADIDLDNTASKFRKYVVMISTTPMIFVDTPAYITTDILSYESPGFEVGLYNADDYITSDSGADTAIVDVYIDKMISAERSGYMYSYNSSRYYFERSYIDELDRKIGSFKAAGMSVSLRLMVGSDKFEYLVYPDSSYMPDSYFANITTLEGYANTRAAVEFLTQRYASDDNKKAGVDSFIVGKLSNTGSDRFYAPGMSMTDFVQSYADLLRFVYICASNISSSVRVYAAIGDTYEYACLENTDNRFDSKLFIEALNTYIADEGSFPWGICIDSYSSGNTDRVLSANNFASFDKLFSSEVFKNNNIPVTVIDNLSYTGISGTSEHKLALSRIMRAAMYGKINKYIVSCENLPSQSADTAFAIKAFMSNDTVTLASLGCNIKDYEEFITNKIIRPRTRSLGTAVYELPFTPAGKYVYFSLDSYSDLDSVSSSYSTKDLRLLTESSGLRTILFEFERDVSGKESSPMGVAVFFERSESFANTPFVAFDLKISDLSEDADDTVPITLRFTGENHIYDVSAVITPDSEQTVYADLSEYGSELYDSLQIFIHSNTADKASLSLGTITGYSGIHSDSKLTELVENSQMSQKKANRLNPIIVTSFIVVITVLVTLTIILVLKSRRSDKIS